MNFDDYSLIDLAFNTQGGALRGESRLVQIGQMAHFTQEYMWHFIAWYEQFDVYLTPEDFFPDGVPW